MGIGDSEKERSRRKPQRGLVGWAGHLMAANRIGESVGAEVRLITTPRRSTLSPFGPRQDRHCNQRAQANFRFCLRHGEFIYGLWTHTT
jgi:hypothetical protein